MMSLRATSMPDRSSRGSGSVYPLALAAPHDGGEALAAVEDVEQVGQGAGENSLDARDLIARVAQVAQRLDDGQARAHRGLVQIMRARRAPRLLQFTVIRQRAAVGLSCWESRRECRASATRRSYCATSALAVQSTMTVCGM